MNNSQQLLQIPVIKPTFFFSLSLGSCTEDSEALGDLLATQSWYQDLFNLNNDGTFLSSFTPLSSDLPNYRDAPSPEKRPIDETYFDEHGSISTQYSIEERNKDGFRIESVTVRIFEHGGITTRCSFTQIADSDNRYINDLVPEMRVLREEGQKVMFKAVSEFIDCLNEIYESVDFDSPEGFRSTFNFDRYEYISLEFEISESNREFDKSEFLNKEERIDELRELIGVCRMSKPYAWPNHSEEFLYRYMEKDLGNRDDELWFISAQRFVRYFPDSDVSETSDYVQDILLVLEIMLSLRSSYKNMIEDVRRELGELPSSFRRGSENQDDFSEEDIENIQRQLSLISYRLSRTQFPSIVRYHSQGEFAGKVLTHIEKELQLPQLSEALQVEMEKFHGAIDSFSSLITHHRSMKLQRRVLILTVVVGLVGSLIAFADIFIA